MQWAPTALGNYYQILDRAGWAQQAAQWMPTVRSAMLGFAVAIIPLSLLFIMTGAGLRALLFPIGMIVFVMVWEVLEAFAHVSQTESALRSFSEAMQHGTGLRKLPHISDR